MATNAVDDDDVGQISDTEGEIQSEDDGEVGQIPDTEEGEIQFTDGDGLRRLPSNEAPQLLGTGQEEGERMGSSEGDGDDRGAQRDGGDRVEESDHFDDDSDASKSLSELDESHAGGPGGCTVPCNNDYGPDCHCECQRCIFKYFNDDPPNLRRFKKGLRRAFLSPSSENLADPPIRAFRACRPYDYSQDSTVATCTQMIPWGVSIRKWNQPCPNTRLRDEGRYDGRILPCDERSCSNDLLELDEVCKEKHGTGLPDELWEKLQYPPEDDVPFRPYICEEHIEDSKEFFNMGPNADNLYNAHLIHFCKVHEAQLVARHRNQGPFSTCTCRNVDFTKWQCRSCFTAKVEKLQRHFRRRVNPRWRGNADTAITNRKHYQRDWKGVRRMLQRRHPCLKGHCGRPRLKGLVRNEVLDCRCCGGYIVQAIPPLRRSARVAEQDAALYEEESSWGSWDDGGYDN